MVEGHQVHRVASAHRKLLVGHRFAASSPNGRFADGAADIDKKVLTRVEAVGKNLFYFFRDPREAAAAAAAAAQAVAAAASAPSPPPPPPPPPPRPSSSDEAAAWAAASVAPDEVCVLVHFGMSGAFKSFSRAPGSARPPPEPTPTTRLRLEGLPAAAAAPSSSIPSSSSSAAAPQHLVAHLSAMTVRHGRGGALFAERVRSLGPDPLRDDASPERFFAALRKSSPKKPVGLSLMSQDVVAGVGNIYRAEILFKARVHPEQPAATLPAPAAERLWRHSRELLRRGFEAGSILTVDREDAARLGRPWTRRYVYNQAACGECGGRVASWTMSGRTCYACPACQPLVAGGEDPLARSHAELARRAREEEGAGGLGGRQVGAGGNEKGKGGKGAAAKAAAAAVSASTAAAAAGLAPARRAALAAAGAAVTFPSHCAPDDAAAEAEAAAAAGRGDQLRALLQKLKVAELRARLVAAAGAAAPAAAPASLKKAALVERVAVAMLEGAAAAEAAKAAGAVPTPERSSASRARRRRPATPSGSSGGESEGDNGESSGGSGSEDGVDRADAALARANAPPPRAPPPPPPLEGTRGLRMASAREAALEKLRAGENRGVEHVALYDDGALDAIEQADAAAEGRKKTSKKPARAAAKKPAAAGAGTPKRARR